MEKRTDMMSRERRPPRGAALLLFGFFGLLGFFGYSVASAQGTAGASAIAAPKLDLIKRAMASMKIDQKIRALVDQRVELRARQVRGDNPGMPDSVYRGVRAAISRIYADNTDRPGGLMPRIHTLLDRSFSEDDLRFAVNFNGSDQGKRYRERVPRVINESLEIGRRWSEALEPEIRDDLEARFRGTAYKP